MIIYWDGRLQRVFGTAIAVVSFLSALALGYRGDGNDIALELKALSVALAIGAVACVLVNVAARRSQRRLMAILDDGCDPASFLRLTSGLDSLAAYRLSAEGAVLLAYRGIALLESGDPDGAREEWRRLGVAARCRPAGVVRAELSAWACSLAAVIGDEGLVGESEASFRDSVAAMTESQRGRMPPWMRDFLSEDAEGHGGAASRPAPDRVLAERALSASRRLRAAGDAEGERACLEEAVSRGGGLMTARLAAERLAELGPAGPGGGGDHGGEEA